MIGRECSTHEKNTVVIYNILAENVVERDKNWETQRLILNLHKYLVKMVSSRLLSRTNIRIYWPKAMILLVDFEICLSFKGRQLIATI
jgi:hypothetical protein